MKNEEEKQNKQSNNNPFAMMEEQDDYNFSTAEDKKQPQKPATPTNQEERPKRNRPRIYFKQLNQFLNKRQRNAFMTNRYVDSRMMMTKFPNFLDDLPALPDLKTTMHEYVTDKTNDMNSFDFQLRAIINGYSFDNNYTFTFMFPKYLKETMDMIIYIANGNQYHKYPSLVDFKKKYGDERLSQNSLFLAILGGVFHPDIDLQRAAFHRSVRYKTKSERETLYALVGNKTITPLNSKWELSNTTTMSLPRNLPDLINAAAVDKLQDSIWMSKKYRKKFVHPATQTHPESNSFSQGDIFNNFDRMLDPRLLINTKLQLILLDGIR